MNSEGQEQADPAKLESRAEVNIPGPILAVGLNLLGYG